MAIRRINNEIYALPESLMAPERQVFVNGEDPF